MDLDAAIQRYREDRFTDNDIVRCTGLSVRAWRELIKLRAVLTHKIDRGPGQVRICDRYAFKRATVISILNQSGFSLAVAGLIVLFLPYHTLLYEICDPVPILLRYPNEIDPTTGLPRRIERPIVNWFDPLKAVTAEPGIDWLIEIFDHRFVGIRYDTTKDAVTIFGDLRQQATRFVGWLPYPRRDQFAGGAIERIAQELRSDALIRIVAEREDPSRWSKKSIRDLRRSGYELEHHEGKADPLCIAAEAAVRSPTVKTTINISFAIRKALRRYLGIDPQLRNLELGKSL
jgi:hypothetical protein